MEANNISCTITYAAVKQIGEIVQAWQTVQVWDQLVIIPAKGAGGKGILILKKKNGAWYSHEIPIKKSQVFTHLANILFGIYSFGDCDIALIEEYVQSHSFFQNIYPAGVPDIRIILLKKKVLMGMLRLPTKRSKGKANLHKGGLGVGIDLESGCLKEAYDGKRYLTYPSDSKQNILGGQIPYWESIISLSIRAAQHFPLEYLGVDLVIDQLKGPMVMEMNVRPGLGIQLANRQGLKTMVDQYI